MIPLWMQHVELVVLAGIIGYSVSSFIGSVINCCVQRWMLKKECGECLPSKAIPTILHKQEVLRENTIKQLELTLAEMKGDIKLIKSLLEQAKIHYQENEK